MVCQKSGVKEPIVDVPYTPPHSDVSSPYHSPMGVDSDSPSSPENVVCSFFFLHELPFGFPEPHTGPRVPSGGRPL